MRYIEGDDATSIAYHALGRIESLQPHYAGYQGMMDKVLILLPANEALLRTFSILFSAFFALHLRSPLSGLHLKF